MPQSPPAHATHLKDFVSNPSEYSVQGYLERLSLPGDVRVCGGLPDDKLLMVVGRVCDGKPCHIPAGACVEVTIRRVDEIEPPEAETKVCKEIAPPTAGRSKQ